MTFFLVTIITPSWASVQSENIRVFVNDKQISFPDQKPYIDQNNRTMVPVRFVSEALGAKVDWNGAVQEVTVHDKATVKLKIGQKEYFINGVKQQMDTEAVLTNLGRTMVPMRFISEGIGVVVDYKNIEGVGLIFNFTREFPEEKRAEVIEKVVQETKRELGVDVDIREFEGEYFRQEIDLPTSPYLGYTIPFANEPGARVAYITVDQLPMQVGSHTIYSLEVDDEYVYIQQKASFTSPVGLYIKENGYLNRGRSYGDGKTGIYNYSYPLTLKGEIADGIGKAEKTKVEAFALYSINSKADVEMLVIENPLYEGGN